MRGNSPPPAPAWRATDVGPHRGAASVRVGSATTCHRRIRHPAHQRAAPSRWAPPGARGTPTSTCDRARSSRWWATTAGKSTDPVRRHPADRHARVLGRAGHGPVDRSRAGARRAHGVPGPRARAGPVGRGEPVPGREPRAAASAVGWACSTATGCATTPVRRWPQLGIHLRSCGDRCATCRAASGRRSRSRAPSRGPPPRCSWTSRRPRSARSSRRSCTRR